MMAENWTPGPWGFVASNEHHGPYVSAGTDGTYGDICDCYTMTHPGAHSARNGGESRPVHHQPDKADANARLIAAAPQLYEALKPFAIFLNGIEHARHIGKDGPFYVLSNSAGTFRLEVDDFVAARAALSAARGDGV